MAQGELFEDEIPPYAPGVPGNGGGGGGTVDSVVAGSGIGVDATDPANPIVSATGLQKATVHITAQLLTLFSAPPTLVAAPGVGKVLIPQSGFVQFKPGDTAYNGVGQLRCSVIANEDIYLAASHFTVFGDDDTLCELGVDTIGKLVPKLGSPDEASNPVINYANFPLLLWSDNGADATLVGPILTSAKNAGGAGYAVNDTGTIDIDLVPGSPNPATYTVLSAPGGVVGTYSITNHDPGYAVGTALTTTPTSGGGSGFTIDILTIPAPDGDMWFTVYYTIETLH